MSLMVVHTHFMLPQHKETLHSNEWLTIVKVYVTEEAYSLNVARLDPYPSSIQVSYLFSNWIG